MNCEERKPAKLQFDLNVVPTAQARPRHTTIQLKNGGTLHSTYKNKTQKLNEQLLETALLPYRPKSPINGPVCVQFTAFLPVPKSEKKNRRERILAGYVMPTKKPDIDNLCKQLLDAMTRLKFWNDDKQVVRMYCAKEFGERGFWQVNVEEFCAENF